MKRASPIQSVHYFPRNRLLGSFCIDTGNYLTLDDLLSYSDVLSTESRLCGPAGIIQGCCAQNYSTWHYSCNVHSFSTKIT